MRKDLPQKLFRELLRNSKRSGRYLAQILKVSQPTITRTRHKLEKSGMIQDYTIVPNFTQMSSEIIAVTLLKMRPEIRTPEALEEAKKYTERFPNAIFAATGEGMGMTGVIISFHKNTTDYHRKWNQIRLDWGGFVEDIQSFVVSLEEGEIKRLSLTHLKDVPL